MQTATAPLDANTIAFRVFSIACNFTLFALS